MKLTNKLTLIAGLVASSFALNANAGIVTNNTDILTGVGHEQLSEWLGEDFDLTRIFAKGVDGINSYDWHDAVDNKGATFTVMELFDNETGERRVIGGYNAYSWNSTEGLIYSSETHNFLFNLTTGLKYGKHTLKTEQTFNLSTFGSTFGQNLFDLYVNNDLSGGYTNLGRSYGDRARYRDEDYWEEFAGSYDNWTIGAYETFTLSDSTGIFGSGANAALAESGLPNDVPVPFALAGLSLLGLGFARRK